MKYIRMENIGTENVLKNGLERKVVKIIELDNR